MSSHVDNQSGVPYSAWLKFWIEPSVRSQSSTHHRIFFRCQSQHSDNRPAVPDAAEPTMPSTGCTPRSAPTVAAPSDLIPHVASVATSDLVSR